MLSLCFLTMLMAGMWTVPTLPVATQDWAGRQAVVAPQPAPAVPYTMAATVPRPQPSGRARIAPAPAPRTTPDPPPLQRTPHPVPGQQGTTTVYVYNYYASPPQGAAAPAAAPAVDPDVEDAYYNPVYPAADSHYVARPQYLLRGQFYPADVTLPYPNPPNNYIYRYLAAVGEHQAQVGVYYLRNYVPLQTPWLHSGVRPRSYYR